MDSNETWIQLEWNDESEDEDEDEDEDIDLETSNWSWSKRGGMFQYELPESSMRILNEELVKYSIIKPVDLRAMSLVSALLNIPSSNGGTVVAQKLPC